MASTDPASAVSPVAQLERVEREVVDLFVRLAEVAGLPRSVGEIYGCLFICADPLPMDGLMSRLNLSKGAVSQGLRLLRSFGAVRTVYVPGDRRDHFTAERELRKLVSGYLQEKVVPHLRSGDEGLKEIRALLTETNGGARKVLQERVAQLSRWHRRAEQMIPLLLRMLQT
ncbi:MAG: hypothetical protein N2652_00010 [Kiritimatiellae bacterium]|nr:hypothetical protein [Kiritimatiellia bacterium]